MVRSSALVMAAACLLAFAGGCPAGNSKQAVVTGTVTYQGEPLPNAQVNFAPVDGGPIASGRTDASGRFRLGTSLPDDGAAIGKHRISVIARGPDRPARPGESGSGMPGETMSGEPLIPKKYLDAQTSGLEREVSRGSNDFTIDLK